MWRMFRLVLGVLLVVLGLLALVTPLTPGSWLALIGMELLGFGFLLPARVRSALARTKERIRSSVQRNFDRQRSSSGKRMMQREND